MLELVSGIFDYTLLRMRNYIFLILITLAACKSETDYTSELNALANDEVAVQIMIDNEPFYPKNVPFSGRISLSPTALNMSLLNKEGGNILVNIDDKNWVKAPQKKVQFNHDSSLDGSFMIGRRNQNRGEGYMLNEGQFQITQLNKDAIVLNIEGILIHPFVDTIQKPIKGYILWKKPEPLQDIDQYNEFLFP